jgi:ribosomal protein S18 acetylase RimI-like enzyme
MASPHRMHRKAPYLNPREAGLQRSTPSGLLDNPIWNSLLTEHSSLALSNQVARRFPSAIGPLSGILRQSPEAYEALRTLAGPGGVVVLFCTEPPAPTPGWTLIRGGVLTQMICEKPRSDAPMTLTRGEDFRPLSTADVPQMVALAKLTEPGPFRDRTIELGAFFGIFEAGRLVAMAGQRLHLPRHVEVSAVCTHPDARGRGYARMLIATVMDEIFRRGKTPFLHSFADNWPAIRVYESLGFRQRRTFQLAVLKNSGGERAHMNTDSAKHRIHSSDPDGIM